MILGSTMSTNSPSVSVLLPPRGQYRRGHLSTVLCAGGVATRSRVIFVSKCVEDTGFDQTSFLTLMVSKKAAAVFKIIPAMVGKADEITPRAIHHVILAEL